MDYSVTITKRRSLPRILCSSKKNTWSSPIETNLIKQIDDTGSDQQALALLKQEIESSEDEDRRSTPEQRLSGGSPIPPSLPNSQPSSSSPLLTTAKETTSPALCRSEVVGSTDNADPGEERVDEQEIRVSPMITVRRGPQVRLPPRRVRCSLTTSENADTSLTPNEMLLAVSLFSWLLILLFMHALHFLMILQINLKSNLILLRYYKLNWRSNLRSCLTTFLSFLRKLFPKSSSLMALGIIC